MPKPIQARPKTDNRKVREKIKFFYLEKFFNKWMNKYDFVGLNYQQKHYIMKKFWSVGTIAVSSIKSADESLAGLMIDKAIDMKEDSIIFTPWASGGKYNIYDFPTGVSLINNRGVKFITPKILEVDKDVVIIYAQKNHKSVFSTIEAKLMEIIDLEMKKRVSLKAQSQPWMYAFSPEDFDQAKAMQEQMENDEPYMFVSLYDVDKAKNLTSGAPFIVDKLQALIDGRVNEILTLLGCNNLGVDEKKEHLVVDEINANNEDVAQSSAGYSDEIREGFERVNSVLGYYVDVIDNNEKFKQDEQFIDEEGSSDENI